MILLLRFENWLQVTILKQVILQDEICAWCNQGFLYLCNQGFLYWLLGSMNVNSSCSYVFAIVVVIEINPLLVLVQFCNCLIDLSRIFLRPKVILTPLFIAIIISFTPLAVESLLRRAIYSQSLSNSSCFGSHGNRLSMSAFFDVHIVTTVSVV